MVDSNNRGPRGRMEVWRRKKGHALSCFLSVLVSVVVLGSMAPACYFTLAMAFHPSSRNRIWFVVFS